MEFIKRTTSSRVARFAIVGLANTLVNFAVLNFAVFGLHQNKLVSSVVATTCAIIFSFVMNRSFVFGDKERPFRKFLMFTIVAASGVLAIQTSAYAFCLLLLQDQFRRSTFAAVNLSNLIASLCVMLWNYNGYRLFVFNVNMRAEGGKLTEEANDANEAA